MATLDHEPFGLLEMGSNSLKFYLVKVAGQGPHSIQTHKFPWKVAHDFFSTGRLEEGTVQEMLRALRAVEAVSEGVPLPVMLTLATGVFREVADLPSLASRIRTETGIRIRVISGEDEARLMARASPERKRAGTFLLCDLGGATTEWARIQNGAGTAWGSLPLGAIRNEYRFRHLRGDPEEYVRRSRVYCDEHLGALPAIPGTAVLAAGGTARAAALCAGTGQISAEALSAMVHQVARDGPPPGLKPERRAVFLPGLIILERILGRSHAAFLESSASSVRDGMAFRLARLLATHRRAELHSTLLLHTHWS